MKLVTRLWLLGALVPSLGTLAIAVCAGLVLRFQLESSLDRALLTQAAVESVSLFDGPDEPGNSEGEIHLHMETSPIPAGGAAFRAFGRDSPRRRDPHRSFPGRRGSFRGQGGAAERARRAAHLHPRSGERR